MPTDPRSPTRAYLARELLRYKMEEHSQYGFCASWMVDLEWDLWYAADQGDSSPFSADTISTSRECRTLAQIAGGWWVYGDETRPGEPGPIFVPMDRWQAILANRNRTKTP